MIIEMSYAEMSLLRELVKAKQLKIWRTVWLPRLRDKNKSAEELNTLFNEIMNKEENWTLTDTSCCQKLLSRFREAEQKVQKALVSTKEK